MYITVSYLPDTSAIKEDIFFIVDEGSTRHSVLHSNSHLHLVIHSGNANVNETAAPKDDAPKAEASPEFDVRELASLGN